MTCEAGKPGRRRAEGKQRQQRPVTQKIRSVAKRAATLTQPLRKEITAVWKEMEKLNAQLARKKLGDSSLYDDPSLQSGDDRVSATAGQRQIRAGKECEMAWLEGAGAA